MLAFFFPIEWAVCAAIAVVLMPTILTSTDVKIDYVLCALFVLQFCAQTPMFPAAMGIASAAAAKHGDNCIGTGIV